MKSVYRLALALLVSPLLIGSALRAEDSADVIALRAKAEQGNSIAQYNLGLAYSKGVGTEVNLPEAFVWLTLASENGTKGPALEKTLDALSPAQLSEAKRRLDARRAGTSQTTTPAAVPPASEPAAPAVTSNASPATDLTALQAQLADANQSISRLTQKNQELEASASQASAGNSAKADVAKKLAETEDKLSTSLRSFTLLRDENDQNKAALDKASTEKTSLASQLEAAQATITNLNQQLATANAAAAQSAAYHDQLRQTQDQLASVSAENSELRGRIAATSPNTGTLLSSPTRPGAAPTGVNPTPLPAFEPDHAASPTASASPVTATAPAPAPKTTTTAAASSANMDSSVERTHVVVAGDTLSSIALHYYGKSVRWAEILDANRTILRDEKSLRVGMKLRIPVLASH